MKDNKLNEKLTDYAQDHGWVITDELQVAKRITKNRFAVVEANQIAGRDVYVLSKAEIIDLRDYFINGEGKTTDDFTDELKSIVLSFFQSYEDFEECYEGDLEFRNRLLATMIYEQISTLSPLHRDKVDKDFAIDYLCEKMCQFDPQYTFYVTCRVTGKFSARVDAASETEAKEKAIERFEEADFGDLKDSDMEIVRVDNLEI